MSSPRLPPLSSLEAFVAVARSLSFRKAAALLHLSPSAVSRRIAALEARLGYSLFERGTGYLALTADGRRLLEQLMPQLQALQKVFDDGRPNGGPAGLVRISLIQSFAANWLVPRLGDFYAAYPGIVLDLHTSAELVDLGAGRIDLGIRFGKGGWDGVYAERMLDINLFPVCAAALADTVSMKHAADATTHLHLRQLPNLWPTWYRAAGYPPPPAPQPQFVFDNAQLLYAAAASGIGIAPGADILVAPYLADGSLVPLAGPRVLYERGFYAVCAPAALRNPAVAGFIDWFRTATRTAPTVS